MRRQIVVVVRRHRAVLDWNRGLIRLVLFKVSDRLFAAVFVNMEALGIDSVDCGVLVGDDDVDQNREGVGSEDGLWLVLAKGGGCRGCGRGRLCCGEWDDTRIQQADQEQNRSRVRRLHPVTSPGEGALIYADGFWRDLFSKKRLRRRILDSNPYQRMVAASVQAVRRNATTARLPSIPY